MGSVIETLLVLVMLNCPGLMSVPVNVAEPENPVTPEPLSADWSAALLKLRENVSALADAAADARTTTPTRTDLYLLNFRSPPTPELCWVSQ